VLKKISSFKKIKYLKISLESGDEKVNDAIRGRGNFKKVNENIPLILEHTKKEIILMMTLAKYNLHTIPATLQFARKFNIKGIIFERFIPLGNGVKLEKQTLNSKEFEYAINTILKLANLDVKAKDLIPYRGFWLWTKKNHGAPLRGAPCNLGDESMALMPNGDVYPCRRFPLEVGNVLQQPFDEIVEHLKKFSTKEISPRLLGKCKLCKVDNCAGCRALSLAIHKDYLHDDSHCLLHLKNHMN